ncbi:uncharacterized protein LOC127786972 isoform X2 [Diospyros lotus]|uniref:uncharacterized protein LOC127786972 isoform X2 n=1 Tax=Diospyros lotus TaxID=55363 RepID=UPI002256F72B|nr:uncharacterized protein LOC127786972 isoform X2 [Diospyros lotus]
MRSVSNEASDALACSFEQITFIDFVLFSFFDFIHIQISSSRRNCLFPSVSNIESMIYHICGLDHFFCKESSRQSGYGRLPQTHFVCGSPDHLNAPPPPTPPVPPAASAYFSPSSSGCRQSRGIDVQA